MSAYRFCRTDDIGLLVDALNRSWAPHFPGEPPITAASFKRSIRDLQVWCSSCMVAFAGADPIGVLIGAKRPAGTLIHRIAVHPDHVRQGHGRHLLASLSSKLAILGPPRMVAEVPEGFAAARALFRAAGYVEEAVLTDYVLQPGATGTGEIPARFIIPVTVDDLAANGLLETDSAVCWERSVESLIARKDEISGLAVASDERIEACILYIGNEDGNGGTVEVALLRSFIDDEGAGLAPLILRLGPRTCRFPKVHPAEIPQHVLDAVGFRPAGRFVRYGAAARSA